MSDALKLAKDCGLEFCNTPMIMSCCQPNGDGSEYCRKRLAIIKFHNDAVIQGLKIAADEVCGPELGHPSEERRRGFLDGMKYADEEIQKAIKARC